MDSTHKHTHTLQLLDLIFSFQIAKLLKEGIPRGKLGWLQEVEQTEQLLYAVLEGGACQENTVLLRRERGGRERR